MVVLEISTTFSAVSSVQFSVQFQLIEMVLFNLSSISNVWKQCSVIFWCTCCKMFEFMFQASFQFFCNSNSVIFAIYVYTSLMISLSHLFHNLLRFSCKKLQDDNLAFTFSGCLELDVYMEGMMTVDLASSVILLQSFSSRVDLHRYALFTHGVLLDFHVLGIHAVHIVVRKVCISRSILCYFQYLNLIH